MRIWPRSAFRVGAWGALHPGSGIRPFRAGAGARPRVVPSPAPAPQYGRLRRPASSPSPSRRSTAGARGVARPAAAAVRDPTPGRRLPPEAVRRLARSQQRLVGYAGRCVRLLPDAARSGATVPARADGRDPAQRGAAGSRLAGPRTAERARRSQGSAPPTPHARPGPGPTHRTRFASTDTRSGVRPTDIYLLARDTPGRRSTVDTPIAGPCTTPPGRGSSHARVGGRIRLHRSGAAGRHDGPAGPPGHATKSSPRRDG